MKLLEMPMHGGADDEVMAARQACIKAGGLATRGLKQVTLDTAHAEAGLGVEREGMAVHDRHARRLSRPRRMIDFTGQNAVFVMLSALLRLAA